MQHVQLSEQIIAIMMMMIIIIIIIIIIKITTTIMVLKGTNRHFYNLLTAPRTVCDTLKWPGRNRVQITCNTSSAYHVQPAVCHLVRRDSSAIKFDRVDIAFI